MSSGLKSSGLLQSHAFSQSLPEVKDSMYARPPGLEWAGEIQYSSQKETVREQLKVYLPTLLGSLSVEEFCEFIDDVVTQRLEEMDTDQRLEDFKEVGFPEDGRNQTR